MKKMKYGNIACTISVVENYTLVSQIDCDYGRDTVAYAVERFFVHSESFRKDCTWNSWQIRVAKGKARKKKTFVYLIPAMLMELPGNWVRICGDIDIVGVNVKKVEILKSLNAR